MKGLCVVPISVFIESPPEPFKPRFFGAGDWIEQKRLRATPRLSPPMVDMARTLDGRLWVSPKAWRNTNAKD